jgi:hypothetical protein
MPDLVSKNFKVFNARQFQEMFDEETPSNIYLAIGNPIEWIDDNNPPLLSDNIKSIDYDVWPSLMSMKKIIGSNVTFSIPRYNWTSGEVYVRYDDQANFNNGRFYVLTDDFNVYKCLDNNNSLPSTVKPTGTLNSVITTSDGYKWKFMFSVTTSDALKFLSNEYIPVKNLTSDDGSLQWQVQNAAVNGSIDTIFKVNGGNSYVTHTGQTVGSSINTITLESGASTTNNIYNNMSVFIVSGTGAGQLRTISSYSGAARQITVSQNWVTQPDVTSTYIVSPRISVTGDGSGCTAYSTVNIDGTIQSINVLTPGSNYTYGTAEIIADNAGAAGTARVVLPPIGGHGKDFIKEFYATNVTMYIKYTGSESGIFPTNNDFRMLTLIANPLLTNDTQATGTLYTMCHRMILSDITDTFSNDEIVTGQTSGATGRFVYYHTTGQISITDVKGVFSVGEIISGDLSNATGVIDTLTLPSVKRRSGNVLFVRTSSPVYRSTEQEETFRITVRF